MRAVISFLLIAAAQAFVAQRLMYSRRGARATAIKPLAAERESHIQITDVEAELIARELRETYDFSFIPNPIERIVVKQTILAFVSVCPTALPEGVFLQLVAGDQSADGLQEATLNAVNDAIDIPLISRDAQDKIVETICKVLFTSSSLKSVRRKILVRNAREVLNHDSREELATKLNDMVDIPFIDEVGEQKAAEKLIDVVGDAFERIVPEDVQDVLQASSPEELRDVRQNIVAHLNKKLDVPWVSEQQERETILDIVDFWFNYYGLGEGIKTPAEKKAQLEYQLDCVEVELKAQRIVADDIEADLLAKQKKLKADLDATCDAIAASV